MKQEKSTKDIYLAAAWMALGAEYERVDRTDPKHQVFYFSANGETINMSENHSSITVGNKLDLEKVEQQWVNEAVFGNLYEYARAIQKMKAIIHSR